MPVRRLSLLFLAVCTLFASAGLPATAKWAAFGAAVTESATASIRDTTTFRHDIRTSFKVYPSPLWSRTSGFAAGVGYEIDNLFMPRGRLLATVKPGQHTGRYTLTYFARDAYQDPVYSLANVYYETTGRQWFYGLGPASSRANKVHVEKRMLEAELRVGVQPLGRLFHVQPLLKYIRHDAAGFSEWDEGALERLDEESLQNLELVTSGDGLQEGLAFGVVLGVDLLDRPIHPRSGILAQVALQRFSFQEPDDLSYDQHSFYLYGYVPLGQNVIALRAITMLTDQRGDTPIPFYFLPSLHGRLLPGYSWERFVGPDLLVFNVEFIRPLFNLFDVLGMDGLVSLAAGNVYEDLFDQFRPAISFDKSLDPDRNSYPLRPSAAVGFDLYSPRRGGLDFRALLGLGTEGIRLVRFSFVADLRDIQLGVR